MSDLRSVAIGVVVTALAVVAMGFDHLHGGSRKRLATAGMVLGAITLVLCGVGSDWSSKS